MDKKAQNNSEPLTLEALVQYSNEVLLEAINKQFEKRDKVLTTHSEQFETHGELLHKIVTKLAEHDERFEKVATKEAVAELRDKILTARDENTELLCTRAGCHITSHRPVR